MDQRFSIFFLEKYRLQLQRGVRPSYEDEIQPIKMPGPNHLRQLISRLVTASSKRLKQKDSSLMPPQRTTNQSYSD